METSGLHPPPNPPKQNVYVCVLKCTQKCKQGSFHIPCWRAWTCEEHIHGAVAPNESDGFVKVWAEAVWSGYTTAAPSCECVCVFSRAGRTERVWLVGRQGPRLGHECTITVIQLSWRALACGIHRLRLCVCVCFGH